MSAWEYAIRRVVFPADGTGAGYAKLLEEQCNYWAGQGWELIAIGSEVLTPDCRLLILKRPCPDEDADRKRVATVVMILEEAAVDLDKSGAATAGMAARLRIALGLLRRLFPDYK